MTQYFIITGIISDNTILFQNLVYKDRTPGTSYNFWRAYIPIKHNIKKA